MQEFPSKHFNEINTRGPLQLAIHMVQNHHAGEQKYHVNGLLQRAYFEMLCNRRIINPTEAYKEWHLMNYIIFLLSVNVVGPKNYLYVCHGDLS